MNRARRKVIESSEVSQVVELELGGYMQKVLLDGMRAENPVVIFLHGGPGTPIPFSVGCRGMFPDITEKVTMVCWDQLGCGINDYPIDDSFSIDNFVEMTVDLIKAMKARFPNNRLYLMGVSWGSVLAARAAVAAQDMLNGVLIYGQVLCDMTFNEEVYSALEGSKMPKSRKRQLQKIKMRTEHSEKEAQQVMGWIRKYTQGYICKEEKTAPMGDIIRGLMSSPDYTMRDFKAMVVNGYMKNKSLIRELTEADMREVLRQVKVPYVIMQGSTDIVTSTAAIERFAAQCGNENIRVVRVEKSGHMPGEKAMGLMIEEAAALTANK